MGVRVVGGGSGVGTTKSTKSTKGEKSQRAGALKRNWNHQQHEEHEGRDMVLRYAAIVLSILVIVALDAILLLGALVHDPQSIRAVFDGVVIVIDLSLVSSSGLLGILFIRRQNRLVAALFFLNIVIFVIAFILRASGVFFPPLALYGADIYWLNLYLVCLARYWPRIAAGSP
jgi:hypothetical protein